MKLFDIIFGKKEDVKRVHQYAENLAYGYEENLYPALYELYKYDSKEIRTVAKACTDMIGDKNGDRKSVV